MVSFYSLRELDIEIRDAAIVLVLSLVSLYGDAIYEGTKNLLSTTADAGGFTSEKLTLDEAISGAVTLSDPALADSELVLSDSEAEPSSDHDDDVALAPTRHQVDISSLLAGPATNLPNLVEDILKGAVNFIYLMGVD